jgi:mercuric ion transport protein
MCCATDDHARDFFMADDGFETNASSRCPRLMAGSSSTSGISGSVSPPIRGAWHDASRQTERQVTIAFRRTSQHATLQDGSVGRSIFWVYTSVMKGNRLFHIGLAGTVLAALCCFTPLLALVLPAIGLTHLVPKADSVLIPVLIMSAAFTFWAYSRGEKE